MTDKTAAVALLRRKHSAGSLTPQIVYAASRDAGYRSMRAAGRTAWNEDDLHAAWDEFERLTAALGLTEVDLSEWLRAA